MRLKCRVFFLVFFASLWSLKCLPQSSPYATARWRVCAPFMRTSVSSPVPGMRATSSFIRPATTSNMPSRMGRCGFLTKIFEARPWWWGFFLLFHTSCHDVVLVTICVQTLLSVMVFVLQWPRHYTDSGSAHLHHSHQGHKCVLSGQRMPPSSSQHWPHWIPLQTGSYKPQIWRGAIKFIAEGIAIFCVCACMDVCVCVHRQEYMREYSRQKKQDSIDLLLFHHFQLFLVLRMFWCRKSLLQYHWLNAWF